MYKTLIEKKSVNVLQIAYSGLKSKTTLEHFFCSDIHIDNPKCQKEKFISDLKRAQDKNALIFIFGDLLDLMQGRRDNRSNKGSLFGHLAKDNYISAVVDYAFEILEPFKDNLAMISRGNHETSVLKQLEIDPLQLLARDLQRAGSPVQLMPYQGWVLFKFKQSHTTSTIRTLFYSHGNWHGVISMGTQAVRRYAAVANADYFVSGDNHERWNIGHAVFKLKQNFEQEIVNQVHIKTGTYKEEFASGDGWAVERIGLPKVLGGTYLNLEFAISAGTIYIQPEVINRF